MPDEKKYTEKTEVKTETKDKRWGTPETEERVEYRKETTEKTEKDEEEEQKIVEAD